MMSRPELESRLGIEARGGHRREDRLEQGRERLRGLGEFPGRGPHLGVRVEDGEVELILGGVEVDEQVVDLVEHLGGPRILAVDLVDDDDRRQARLERLLEHEARLRQRPLGGVDEQQHPVDERERPLDLRAEVGVPGRVDDVDPHPAVGHRDRLGHDRDALLALEVDRVQHALGHRLVRAKEPRLPEHRVDERGLSVVDVGDDRDVTNVGSLLHRSIVPHAPPRGRPRV